MSWLSNSTLRRIIASEFFDSLEREPSASRVSSAAITGVSGVRSSCESIARKLSLVRFAASTASFCCSSATWVRLRSVIAAAIPIAVIVNAAVHDCSIKRLVFRLQNERSESMERSPNCDGRKNKDASGCFARRETKRGPDDDRSANERDRIIPRRNRKPSTEHGFRQHHKQQQEDGNF